MDHTFVDEKSLKTLDELVVFLGANVISLRTLLILQAKSIKCGIMKEDMNVRSAHIIGCIQDLIRLYEKQMEACFDLLPDDFNSKTVTESLQKQELVRARAMIKKPKT